MVARSAHIFGREVILVPADALALDTSKLLTDTVGFGKSFGQSLFCYVNILSAFQ